MRVTPSCRRSVCPLSSPRSDHLSPPPKTHEVKLSVQTRRRLSSRGSGWTSPPRPPDPPGVPPAAGSPAGSLPGSLVLLLQRKPEALETSAWVGGHPLRLCSWCPQRLRAAVHFHPRAVASLRLPGGLSWSASPGLTSAGVQGKQLRCAPFVKVEVRVGVRGAAPGL